MTRLARTWARLFGTWYVLVFAPGQHSSVFSDADVVWAWHRRGVLHVVTCWYGGKYDPVWRLARYSFPLAHVAYWTKEKERDL